MKALEILQVDQPGKPWKAFAHRARALADSLSCSWADGDSPVHVKMAQYVFDADLEVPVPPAPARPSPSSMQGRVYDIIRRNGAPMSGYAVAKLLGFEGAYDGPVRAAINKLSEEGRICRAVAHKNNGWVVADPKERAA